MSDPRETDADAAGHESSTSPRRPHRRLIIGLVVLAVLASASAMALYRWRASTLPPKTEWGVTFSIKASRAFKLDWRQNYLAILNELKPSGVRLVAYWDLIELTPGHYDFRDLDWQIDEAEKADVPVILAVGQKVPRWPEYHLPKWLDADDKAEREKRLLVYLSRVVKRYKDRDVLLYWQVENEPFVTYGTGPGLDTAFLEREVALVRKLDPRHQILQTDGGEWGKWYPSAELGDAFGTTLYRRVYRRAQGSFTPSRTPEYYADKVAATKMAIGRPDQKYICSELQAEPWGHTLNHRMTIEEQMTYFPEQTFAENIEFARETGMKTFYLWGAEWWYYLKLHGRPVYWELAKQLMLEG